MTLHLSVSTVKTNAERSSTSPVSPSIAQTRKQSISGSKWLLWQIKTSCLSMSTPINFFLTFFFIYFFFKLRILNKVRHKWGKRFGFFRVTMSRHPVTSCDDQESVRAFSRDVSFSNFHCEGDESTQSSRTHTRAHSHRPLACNDRLTESLNSAA